MVNFHLAYTAPINPEGASPVLTTPQIWAGLQRKIRRAQEFVPAILECEVIEEKTEGTVPVVTRVVKFAEGMGPPGPVKEVVKSYEPAWVDFIQEDGSVVKNVVSGGPGEDDKSLSMTYIFEWHHPELEEGSEDAKAKLAHYRKLAKLAVDKSIEKIRQLVKEEKI